MKKILTAGIVLMGIILAGCQSSGTAVMESSDGEAFELYLIADEQVAGTDLENYEVTDLSLADQPLIQTDDLISYNWENHTINLTQEAYANVIKVFSQGMPIDGVPFVIVSGGKPLYAGSFWTPLSSLSYDGVVILQPMDPTNAPLFVMLGYPGPDYFTGKDPRANLQLKQALQNAGVLD